MPFLMMIGRRLHVDHLGAAGIADRAAPRMNRMVCSSIALRRIVDAGMVILRPVEDHRIASKASGSCGLDR